MNVVIVGPFWFPRGAASASRIRNLALGLRARGAQVHVITMLPRPAVQGEAVRDGGDFEGVTYECVAPTTAAVSGWRDAQQTVPRLRGGLGDKVGWFAGMYGATFRARRRLREWIASHRCDLVFVYDRSAARMTPLVRLCRELGVPCVLDVTEASEHLGSRLSPLYWDFALGTRFTARLFDGLTVITTGLAAFYRARGCERTLVVPAVEEWRPGPPPPPTGNTGFRLAYVGSLQPRDAPEALFETVRLVAEGGAGTSVEVIGHYEGTERGERFARQCAADPVLRGSVRFLGTLSDETLRAHLDAADGILLTRRDARTEALSFPTRLVEHLRHGRPLFVSDVGDVSHYLKDGREAVLLDPRDPRRAAAAIAAVVRRPDRGASIGHSGRDAGARAFDREVHAARLLDFAAALSAGGAA